MSIQNQANVDTANTLFRAYGEQLFANAGMGAVLSRMVEVIPTQAEVNELDILECMPVVREWIGEKRFDTANFATQSVTMKSYEKSFSMQRRKLAGMTVPQLAQRIQSWLGNAAGMYEKIIFDTLTSASGAGPTCYDGAALLSASHVRPAQSNKSTTAYSAGQHEIVVRTMQSLTDANGEPLGISPNLIICGPKPLPRVLEVTKSTERLAGVSSATLEQGTTVAASTIPNVFAGSELYGGGTMEVLVSNRLVGTQDDYVYFVDTTKGASPLVLFEKRSPEMIPATNMESSARFNRDLYQWSLECDIRVAPGMWQTIYGIIL